MVECNPPLFRRDVISVVREGDATHRQVAKDFGISETCLQRWLRVADRDEGLDPAFAATAATKAAERAALKEAQDRIRLLEQENDILRRTTAYVDQSRLPNELPAGP